MEYSQKEKLEITLDNVKKLKEYPGVNLFNDCYTFIPKLKKVFQEYIKGNSSLTGTLEFEEIGKQIKYSFPCYKPKKATFIIKIK